MSKDLLKRLQKLIKSTAGYVNSKYSNTNDSVKLGWLPAKERINFALLKLAHKALHNVDFPQYLKLEFKQQHSRSLRSNDDCIKIKFYGNTSSFRDTCFRTFNSLPLSVRSDTNYKSFAKKLKRHLMDTSNPSLPV